jgi:signal transduction histidine kinase
MGSRGRSIRLRIYFLVAVPLIALVGLLGYEAGTSINNAINLDRVPNLINATAIPAANFGTYLQSERAAAVVYLFQPSAASLAAYQSAIAATNRAEPAFAAAMHSQATTGSENPAGAKAVTSMISGLSQLPALRQAASARAISALDALGLYSQGASDQATLFLIQTESVTVTDQLSQAIGLIATVQAREQLSQEDALLSGMLASGRITARNRVAFGTMAATRQADTAYANYILSPANQATFNAAQAGAGSLQTELTSIEQAIAAGTPASQLPVTAAGWQQLAGTLVRDQYNGAVAVADAIVVADHRNSHAAWERVAITGGIALLGLLITIAFSILVARGIIRRLRGLERTARTLAEDQLPDVVGRLRRGENVDVAAEAPPLRTGDDEIGRVGQAFELVRQTAIGAAVDEAKLRRGLNDVFRSLARRSQSLLHRQLSLLDQMERRASDPEALDDLFRLDHLTTRMRRHAEGLVILAGATPSRGWSSPVRMVDVMRGAIAEVEDYARVSVATRSQAALAGSAVADVIHLLAELVENATTLSPPYTSVRVSGESVANGFAIEVEDRGLGMSPQRLAELNERLASPPEFNPSDSEQLGLFVVSQLAKRHGIRVTLKGSPYGGTSAVVLIPGHLVVTEEAFRAGLPGEPAAIGTSQDAPLATNGNQLAPGRPEPGLPSPRQGGAGLLGPGQLGPGQLGPGQLGSSQLAPGQFGPGQFGPGQFGPGQFGPGQFGPGQFGPGQFGPGQFGPGQFGPGQLAPGQLSAGPAGRRPARPGGIRGLSELTATRRPDGPGIRISGPLRRAQADGPAAGQVAAGQDDGDRSGAAAAPPNAAGTGPAPDGTAAAGPLDRTEPGPPGRGTAAGQPDRAEAGFDVFTPLLRGPEAADQPGTPENTPGQDGPSPQAGAAAAEGREPAQAGAAAYVSAPTYPGAPPYQDAPAYPGTPPYQGGAGYPGAGSAPYPDQAAAFPGWAAPTGPPTRMTPVASARTGAAAGPPWELPGQNGAASPGAGGPQPPADDLAGLPRRVRQASLAPQLRDGPRRAAAGGGAAEAARPSPEELRKTMTALQRGWQEGRSQPVSPPAADPRPEPAGQEPPEATTGDQRPAGSEPPGGSDGT